MLLLVDRRAVRATRPQSAWHALAHRRRRRRLRSRPSVPLWHRVQRPGRRRSAIVAGAVGIDGFSVFVTVVICAAVILAALLADGYLRREGSTGPSSTSSCCCRPPAA